MAGLIEAISIKRKMYFEFEGAPYHCLDVDVSTPTARGGQTLVRLKMRNLLTRAVFDKTFKAGDKLKEPDLDMVPANLVSPRMKRVDAARLIAHYLAGDPDPLIVADWPEDIALFNALIVTAPVS